MHPLTCVKYGAAALALGPAHSVMVPRGAASVYRICVSIIISAYGTTLCTCAAIMYKFFDFFKLRSVSFTLFSHIYAFQNLCVCIMAIYSVPLTGFTVIIYFVPYILVPLVGLLV